MNAIVIESVSKLFRKRPGLLPWRQGGETRALADISLCVPDGTVQVLLGPNGSGKTTLLKLISTILLPDAGRVIVDGVDTQQDEKAVRRKVGFAIGSERAFYPRLTARENLNFFAAFDEVPRTIRKRRVQELLETTGLAQDADKLVMNFSSGMYQRLGIARALLKNPSVVLLDEPSRSLDAGSASRLWRVLRELCCTDGGTFVIATHSFHEAAAVGDNIAILHRGRLAGQYEAISRPERLRTLYFQTIGEGDDAPVAALAEEYVDARVG